VPDRIVYSIGNTFAGGHVVTAKPVLQKLVAKRKESCTVRSGSMLSLARF
jgi:hypothetical protein